MTYSSHYQTNPFFPYSKRRIIRKTSENQKEFKEEKKEKEKKKPFSLSELPFLQNLLDPIEKLLGRKVRFDDLLLVALIYILFTEKDTENNILLLCLLFILLD